MEYEDELAKAVYEKLANQTKICYSDSSSKILQDAVAKVWNSYTIEQQEEMRKRAREFVVDMLGYE